MRAHLEATGPAATDVPASPSTPKRSYVPVGAVACGVVLAGLVVRQLLRLDFYFDEMWRVDLIESADWYGRYRTQNGPLPPGWVYLMRAVTMVVPADPLPLRLGQLALWAVALTMVLSILRRRVVELHGVALLMVVLPAAFWPMLTSLVSYFNNYVAEIVATVGVFWLLDRDEARATWPLCLALILLPTFALGGLFVLPAVLLAMLMTARRAERSAPTTIAVLVTALGSATVGAVVYLTMYRPVRDPALEAFWARDTLRGNPGGWRGWLDNQWFHARHGLIPRELLDVLPEGAVAAAMIATGGLAVIGLVRMWRLWRPWTLAAVSAPLLCVLASAITTWPSTLVRVNAAWAWLLPFSAVLGAVTVIRCLWTRVCSENHGAVLQLRRRVQHAWRRDGVRTAFVVGPAVAALLASGRLNLAADATFARGLNQDLKALQQQLRAGDVVISYHFMARFYVHDLVINRADVAVELREQTTAGGPDTELYEDLAGWVNAEVDPSTTVWCVLVPELGPADLTRACRLEGTNRRKVTLVGDRSIIVGWRAP